MSPENELALHAKHPIFARPGGSPISRFALDGIAVGDGWVAILDDIATEIEVACTGVQACTGGGARLPEVLQLKAKFGTLRVYIGQTDERLHTMIDRAEQRSATICEICGGVGRLRHEGSRLRTRCDAHIDHRVGENL